MTRNLALRTQYSCDTLTVHYGQDEPYAIRYWITRPVCYAVGFIDAGLLTALFAYWATTTDESIGFVALSVLFGILALFMGTLAVHCLRVMWAIKTVVKEMGSYDNLDDYVSLALITRLENAVGMLSVC